MADTLSASGNSPTFHCVDRKGKSHTYRVVTHTPDDGGLDITFRLLALASGPALGLLEGALGVALEEGFTLRTLLDLFTAEGGAKADDEEDAEEGEAEEDTEPDSEASDDEEDDDAPEEDDTALDAVPTDEEPEPRRVLFAGVELGVLKQDLQRALAHPDNVGLVRRILAKTTRDGKPLGKLKRFNEAYQANYWELLGPSGALWQVIRRNHFLPLGDTSS